MQTSLITKLAQNGQIKPASPMYLTSEAAQPSRIRFTNAVNSMLQEEREREAQMEGFRSFNQPHTERFDFPKVTVEEPRNDFDEYATDGSYHAGHLKQLEGPFENLPDKEIVHSGHLTHRAHRSEIKIDAQLLRIVICIIVGTLALTMFIKIMQEEKRLEMLVYRVSSMKT